MHFRHDVPLLRPGAWFTSDPLAASINGLPARRRRGLVVAMIAQTAAGAAMVLGLSVPTGLWLTYMDFGVWAVAIGAIKAGPAAAAVARREASSAATFRVVRRSVRGRVVLTDDPSGARTAGTRRAAPGWSGP